MALDIVNLVKEQLTSSVISSVAEKLGESENGVTKAFSGLIPTIVGGLADKKDDAASMFDKLKDVASSGVLSNLAMGGEGNSVISDLLSKLFGNKLDGILSSIASFAGIKQSSANSLMNISSAATFGSIGKYLNDNNVSASGLSNLFGSQASGLAKYLPAGLSFAALGLPSLGNLFGGKGEKPEVKVSAPKVKTTQTDGNKGGRGWLKWILCLILLAIIAFLLFRNCCGKSCKKGDAPVETVSEATDTKTGTISNVAQAIRERFNIDLDGITLNAYKGGIEDQMITFLRSNDYKNATEEQLSDKWFSFDNINFVMGKTDQLEAGSEEQLNNVAKILAKYSDAKVKIGGYTDKTGDEATNKAVSQKRAEFLRAELVRLGISEAQIVAAEGYGEEFATVDENASDEERAVDRKMAMRFVK